MPFFDPAAFREADPDLEAAFYERDDGEGGTSHQEGFTSKIPAKGRASDGNKMNVARVGESGLRSLFDELTGTGRGVVPPAKP